MKKYRTSKRNTAQKTLIRDSLNGKVFTLYLPFSTGKTFSIGEITFANQGNNYYKPMQAIPTSWYINLNDMEG
jgi:hypothetical protein